MRFTLPQFADHEAKIVGPLTFKQSAYIVSTGIAIFILRTLIPQVIFLPIAIILGLGSLAFSFLKINGKPLINVLINGFNFFLSSRVYFWKKEKITTTQKIKVQIFEKSDSDESLKVTKTSYLKDIKNKIN